MAKSKSIKKIIVHAASHEYPVLIGEGLLQDKQLVASLLKGKQVLIVSNETIAPFYLKQLLACLSASQCDVVILLDGEQYKNQASLDLIYEALIKNNHHRDTTIIALGGGVVGDIAGFAAATYQRGVHLLQIPTSLLAQVDASVGGKTAINHALGKNMIGSFYQPQAVLIDLACLKTLPPRELRAGLAEIIKYALLAGADFFTEVFTFLSVEHEILGEKLAAIIAQCCEIKAKFVEQDEKETGQRALLNLGHTIGHALETQTQYQRWLHGEAVAIGLYCAALISLHLGYINQELVAKIDQMLVLAHLPNRIPKDIDLNILQSLMQKDKKIKNNNLRFVLIRDLGDCYLENQVPQSLLDEVLKQAKEGE